MTTDKLAKPVELRKKLTQIESEIGEDVSSIQPLGGSENLNRSVGTINGNRAGLGIDLPDQSHARREVLATFAFHLGGSVRLAQNLDHQVGSEGWDRRLGNLAIRQAPMR